MKNNSEKETTKNIKPTLLATGFLFIYRIYVTKILFHDLALYRKGFKERFVLGFDWLIKVSEQKTEVTKLILFVRRSSEVQVVVIVFQFYLLVGITCRKN